jgi:hypothetical protein
VDLYLHCRARAAGPLGGAAVPALPCAGGYGDQPAALMDAFDMLEQMIGEMRNEAD